MYKCGALVSSSKQLLPSLTVAASLVREVLYVPLQSSLLHEEEALSDLAFKINQVYFHISKINPSLDLRVVLPQAIPTTSPLYYSIDALFSPETTFQETSQLPEFLNISQRYATPNHLEEIFKTLTLPENVSLPLTNLLPAVKQYSDVALGGTFDSIHNGHRLLLTYSALIASQRVLVGVADGPLLEKKVLPELIKPVEERSHEVKSLLEDIKPGLTLDVLPITDVYGPTAWDKSLNCLVVTTETAKGGEKVNQERAKIGLPLLEVFTVHLIKDGSNDSATVENKVSSSDLRKKQLGQYHEPKIDNCIKDWKTGPYLIGFTGFTASGKSSIIKQLADLGGYTIDCDKLGHIAYSKGTAAYHKIIEEFGQSVLGDDGNINRKVLGPIVFSDKTKLNKLNEIVWPEIWKLAMNKVQEANENGYKVCILDAAVLLQGEWNKKVHEVWTTIIPVEESIKRVMERDNLSEEFARRRIGSQTTNKQFVDHAHVVFCTLWDYDYTHSQVVKAWKQLSQRLKMNE